MLIRCPNCKVSYDLGAASIPECGKKVHCSQCGETWICHCAELFEVQIEETLVVENKSSELADSKPKDQEPVIIATDVPAEVETSLPVDSLKQDSSSGMQEIFARLGDRTETLFQIEKQQPSHKKFLNKLLRVLGLKRKKTRRLYFFVSLILLLLTLFYLRYDIVRVAPFMEKAYAICGFECIVPGEGLEFENITRTEFEEDYVSKMEIRGFISNVSPNTLEIPTIRVEMLDKNAQALQILYQEAPVKRVSAASRVAFRIVVDKPSTFTKFVYLTFSKETPPDTIKAVHINPRDE